MAHYMKMSSALFYPIQCFYTLITTTLLVLPHAKCLYFNFSSFNSHNQGIFYEGHSSVIGGKIQLTRDEQNSIGRASYNATAVPLWDGRTREFASFTTHFSFRIMKLGGDPNNGYGDGFAFFLAPFDSTLPRSSSAGCLGLLHGGNGACFRGPGNSSQIVAVEFDSYKNIWDPLGDHVGIDVNSVISNATVIWEDGFENGTLANAWVTYDSASFNLSVFLAFGENPIFPGDPTLSYTVDLRTVLPERVRIGFSATTGNFHQVSNIISWEFNSTLSNVKPTPAPKVIVQIKTTGSSESKEVYTKSRNSVSLVGAIVGGIIFISLIMVGLLCWKRRLLVLAQNNKH